MRDGIPTSTAADLLGVNIRTVYAYMRDYPDFPAPRRFGRALVFDRDQLRAWRRRHP
ncbi:DNA-binding protein, partial [Klebsiella pneumoniae]